MPTLRSISCWLFTVYVIGGAVPLGAAVTDIDSVIPLLRTPFNAYPNSNLTFSDQFGTSGTVGFNENDFGTPDISSSFFANRHQVWLSSDGGLTPHPFLNQEGFSISFDLNLDTNAVSPRKEAGIMFVHPSTGAGWLFVTSDNNEIATFGSYFPFTTNQFDDGDGVEYGGVPYTPGTDVSVEVVYRPGIGSTQNGNLLSPASLEFIVNGFSSGARALNNIENGVVDGTQIGLYLQSQVNAAGINTTSAGATFTNIRITPEPASFVMLGLGAAGIARRRRA